MRIESKLRLGLAVTLMVMVLTAVVPFRTDYWASSLLEDLRHSQRRLDQLIGVLSMMQDTETGQRGFIITGRETFLEPYQSAAVRLQQARPELRREMSGTVEDRKAIADLDAAIDAKLTKLAEGISLRRTGGFAAAEPVVTGGVGKQYMDNIRAIVGKLVNNEAERSIALHAELQRRMSIDAYVGLGATLVNMLLLAMLMLALFRVMKQRQETANALRLSTDRLNAGMNELQRRHEDISLMGEMARTLESAQSMKEGSETVSIYCARLMPRTRGILYLFRNSRDLLQKETEWASPVEANETMAPQDCWALRRGQVHKTAGAGDPICNHYREATVSMTGSICMPLLAQGEVLGLLCIQPDGLPHDPPTTSGFDHSVLVATIAEEISLSLSNIGLREALRQQTITDPLTGLFNRRYMDETLRRELSRTNRKSSPLSLIVLDVDHFKRINDMFGHDVGDTVLRAMARQVRNNVRDSDAACRFGGEEFVLILSECDKVCAAQRAEKIRVELGLLDLKHGDQSIGRVTASFGVASFPDDGQQADTLFLAADRAMYLAKKSGRDCVILAG